MTRIADEGNEEYLLMVARHGTAHHVEKLVAKYRSAKRAQDAGDANEQYNDRELTHYYDHDGCLVIKARLPAEQGTLIVKAIEMAMEKDFNESAGADKARSGQTSEIEDGPHVTAVTSRRIACDCTIVGIEEDHNGEPLSIGRRSRSIPPPMRRALRVRDGSCRFPGCTNTRFVDGHHVVHWADGGETSLDNLVLLCRHHHRLVHEGGFGCEKSADGEILFWTPEERALGPRSVMPAPPTGARASAWTGKWPCRLCSRGCAGPVR